MRKMLAMLIAIMLCAAPAAHADKTVEVHAYEPQATTYEDISGDAYWPIFCGLQWSMNEDVVLLLEQARGVEFKRHGDDDNIRMYIADDVQVLGREAKLIYQFGSWQGLFKTTAQFSVADDEDADTVLKDIMAAMIKQYGEPSEDNRPEGEFEKPEFFERLAVWGESDEGLAMEPGSQYIIGEAMLEAINKETTGFMFQLTMQGYLKQMP